MSFNPERVTELSVFMNGDRVGTLYNAEPLEFAYDDAWLTHPAATPLNLLVPLQSGRVSSSHIHAFFENLLPEGGQRKIISLRYHVTTVFGLLATVGGDTAGSIVLLPVGSVSEPPAYERTTWEQINAILHDAGALTASQPGDDSVDETDPGARVTISGAQRKILLSVNAKGEPLRPLGTSPSTHILKPDIERIDASIFASAFNETIVMQAARICQLPTAEVAYQPLTRACVITRYDRVMNADGTLRRIWQADFCQVAGVSSTAKYEFDGGPSFKDCYELLKRNSAVPANDLINLLRWLFFNLYVGNNDSHAKNLALLAAPEGLRLAPFYDLMCTSVYSGLGKNFAFNIGGELHSGKIERKHIETLAVSLGVAPKFMFSTAEKMARQVERAIPEAIRLLRNDLGQLGPSEEILATRIEQKVTRNVKKMRVRILDGTNEP